MGEEEPQVRLVFMGSSPMASTVLSRILAEKTWTVAAVVTQPDRPKGRDRVLAPSPVKVVALERNLNVLTPAHVNAPESLAALEACAPDVIVVVGYGQILKRPLLTLPPHGCINLHASLLPRHRGAAPIPWAIALGDTVTGLTTFFMDEGVDTGDVIFQESVPIESEDTAETLSQRLTTVGGELLVRTLQAVAAGTAPRRPQPAEGATYARRLTKEDGRMDWRLSAREIECRVRGFYPWPVCFTTLPPNDPAGHGPTRLLRVLRAKVEPGAEGTPGQVLEANERRGGPLVATGDGALRLLVVQPEGRPAMSGSAFLCGHRLQPGAILGA